MLASFCGGGLEPEVTEDDDSEECSANIISDLIYQGASLAAQTDRTGETALHLAARYARADAAKRLLDAGADANAQDTTGRTPLHAAVAADAQGVFQVKSPTTKYVFISRYGLFKQCHCWCIPYSRFFRFWSGTVPQTWMHACMMAPLLWYLQPVWQ